MELVPDLLRGQVALAKPALLHPQEGHHAQCHHPYRYVDHSAVHGPTEAAEPLPGGKTPLALLGEEHQIQHDLFVEMQKRGWYQTEPADQAKISQAKGKFQQLSN